MLHEVQNTKADNKNVGVNGSCSNAFFYNVIIPDFALFVIGITAGFAALLSLVS